MPVAGLNVMDMLRNQLKLKQLEIDALLEITQAINTNRSASALFNLFETTLHDQIGVEHLLLFSNNDGKWQRINGLNGSGFEDNIHNIDELLKYRNLTYLAELNGLLPEFLSDYDLLIPVYHKEKPLAFLLMSHPRVESYEPVEDKIKFAQTITNIITVAIENKRLFKKEMEQEMMKRDLEVAAQMQSMFIPDNLPKNNEVEVAAIYMPHQNIGGDYYDFMKLNEDEFFFCIADISGKGISAALLMANFQAQLRALLKRSHSTVDNLIQELNESVILNTRGEKFITLFLGKYSRKTRILKYVNAGHNPPLLFTSKGYKQLDKGCTILGMFDKIPEVKLGQIPIAEDTTIICFTDGLTDLVNEQEMPFQLESVLSIAKEYHRQDVDTINRKLLAELMKFKGEKGNANDDITVLSIKIFGKK